jgi:hypothetical protein
MFPYTSLRDPSGGALVQAVAVLEVCLIPGISREPTSASSSATTSWSIGRRVSRGRRPDQGLGGDLYL